MRCTSSSCQHTTILHNHCPSSNYAWLNSATVYKPSIASLGKGKGPCLIQSITYLLRRHRNWLIHLPQGTSCKRCSLSEPSIIHLTFGGDTLLHTIVAEPSCKLILTHCPHSTDTSLHSIRVLSFIHQWILFQHDATGCAMPQMASAYSISIWHQHMASAYGTAANNNKNLPSHLPHNMCARMLCNGSYTSR